jgi:hypothetical protein
MTDRTLIRYVIVSLCIAALFAFVAAFITGEAM